MDVDAVKQLKILAIRQRIDGIVSADALIEAAVRAVDQGVESPSLSALAGLTRGQELDEAQTLFREAIEQLHIAPPAPVDGRWGLQGKLAHKPVPRKAQAEATTTDSRERLRALSDHRDKTVRVAVAANPAAPLDLLEKLVADKHHLVRYAVPERADRQAWRVALAADHSDVRVILAQRQDLDEATLEALLTDPDRAVRESVGTSTKRADILARLARDPNHHVRATTATNLNITYDDLELLATDRVAQVRAVAAQNPRLSPDTVTRLGADRSGNVRYFILEAHPERLDLAEALKDDNETDIARLARSRLQSSPK